MPNDLEMKMEFAPESRILLEALRDQITELNAHLRGDVDMPEDDVLKEDLPKPWESRLEWINRKREEFGYPLMNESAAPSTPPEIPT